MKKGRKNTEEETKQFAQMCAFVQADSLYRQGLRLKKHYVILKLAHSLYLELIHNNIEYEAVLGYEKHVVNHVLDFLEHNVDVMDEMREWETRNSEKKIGRLKIRAQHAARDLIYDCLPRAQTKHHFGLSKKLTKVEKMLIHEQIPWISTYNDWNECSDASFVAIGALMTGSCRNCGISQAQKRCSSCKVTRFCSTACWRMNLESPDNRHMQWECELMQEWKIMKQ